MIKKENYINIQGWMRKELGLTGNSLLAFAIIFGFCQDEESEYSGGIKYIAEWLGCSYPTAVSAIKSLYDKKLITKREVINKSGRFVNYRVVKDFNNGSLNNLTTHIKNLNNPVVKNLNTEIKDINNKEYIIIDDDFNFGNCEEVRDIANTFDLPVLDSLQKFLCEKLKGQKVDVDRIRKQAERFSNGN